MFRLTLFCICLLSTVYYSNCFFFNGPPAAFPYAPQPQVVARPCGPVNSLPVGPKPNGPVYPAVAPKPCGPVYPPVAQNPCGPVYPPAAQKPCGPVNAPVAPKPCGPVYPPVAPKPCGPVYPPVAQNPCGPVNPPVAPKPCWPFNTPVAPVNPQCFDDTNSDEYDSAEGRKIYPPQRNEKLMPPCCGRVIPACNSFSKYRTYDGSCNNLLHPEWGVPNSTYSNLLPPRYGNGIRTPRRATDNTPLPSARRIRTEIFPVAVVENAERTLNVMQWGQFLAHDMSLLREPQPGISCCTASGQVQKGNGRYCYPIKIPPSDPTMGRAGLRCMNFTRTVTDKDMGCSKGNAPAKQINAVTAFMDLSNVYGNNEDFARTLRTYTNGELKVETRNNKVFPPSETNRTANCPCNAPNENVCYRTGDSRSNQNPQLAILQILFLREHNRLARALKALNPFWSDEMIFQEARHINIGVFQHVTYYEWLPMLLGAGQLAENNIIYPYASGYVNDYDNSKVPDITNEHAHAAFRTFHTHIVGLLALMNANRQQISQTPISNWFNRPQVLEQGSNMEQLTVGLVTQHIQETDRYFVEEVSDKMFACRGIGFGIDLKATDIQRDRDHGLAYYNDYRGYCGLKVAQSFDDFSDFIPQENVDMLKKLYKSHRDVDLSVGGGLESTVGETELGPTFLCLINEQFRRTRQADRFWFEHPGSGFTLAQLTEIRKSTSARLFCDNGDGIQRIQPNTFEAINGATNTPVPCYQIPSMNLNLWK